ncbi:MAG TPA: hypothetical protein VIS74_05995 [Chthoniobacterales bacterium]
MQSDWEIKGRAHTCSRTHRTFEEGEYFYTLLYRDGEGFRREDLSETAWAERNDNIQPFSFWRSKYEPPAPPPPEALKKDDAEGLLRQMLAEPKPGQTNACYILALMLERKRLIRPVESPDEGLLVYEHLKTGDVFTLRNPHLSIEQIPGVQREVAELLGAPAKA